MLILPWTPLVYYDIIFIRLFFPTPCHPFFVLFVFPIYDLQKSADSQNIHLFIVCERSVLLRVRNSFVLFIFCASNCNPLPPPPSLSVEQEHLH